MDRPWVKIEEMDLWTRQQVIDRLQVGPSSLNFWRTSLGVGASWRMTADGTPVHNGRTGRNFGLWDANDRACVIWLRDHGHDHPHRGGHRIRQQAIDTIRKERHGITPTDDTA